MRSVLLLAACAAAFAADWKAGIGRVEITPDKPIFLSGYASRKKPSEGVRQKLWAKAVALQDKSGNRVVIVGTDLIGLSRPVSERIGAEAARKFGLKRSQLMLNSSHTHSGPAVRDNLDTMFDLTSEQRQTIVAYGDNLVEKLVTVIGASLADLQPADVAIGHGAGTFAINRRQFNAQGVSIGHNPKGPVDHDVPVFRITAPDGKLRGVIFGYACHNTTLGGDLFLVNGDYAGYAQQYFEEANPGSTALFLLLCGGDANPSPRGKYEHAEAHGRSLSDELGRVLKGTMKPVTGRIRSAWQTVDLAFAPHTREQFENELKDSSWYRQRRAEAMLRAYDARRPVTTIPYPVQALRFGKAATIVALGGEVVVDYDLRIKKEFAGEDTIVAGYSNDVMGYIASKRVLQEGGYEAVDSHIYYGNPGPFTEEVEETVLSTVKRVMKQVGRSK
jgi:hypothetical protein